MNKDGKGARSVVITGASTGIGEACALRLARGGFLVFAGVRKDTDGERLKQQEPSITPVALDVTNEAQIDAAAKAIGAAVGESGIAGLVNNAGVSVNGPLEYLTTEDLRKQLDVNVVGQVAVTRAFLELIRKGHGRIVNIGSIAGKMTTPFLGPYSASKHAMEAISDALRQELRPWGIHVALVEPGSIATPIWQKGVNDADDLLKHMPEEAVMRYGKAFDALRDAAVKFEAAGIPPDRVAKSVEHALTSGRPRTRYIVGFDATIQRIISGIVPDRLRDRLVAQQLKLPSKP